MYSEDSMEVFINKDYRTISNLMQNAPDHLIIDGIMCTAGDMKMIADTFRGDRITFTEMELSTLQLQELIKWNGDILEFNFCGHDEYNFNMFFRIMNQWKGKTLIVGYQNIPVINTVIDPLYKQLIFRECNVDIKYFKEKVYTIELK